MGSIGRKLYQVRSLVYWIPLALIVLLVSTGCPMISPTDTETPTDQETPKTVSKVTIKAATSQVTEGTAVQFTVTATPAPAASLTVNVTWSDSKGRLAASRPQTVTIGPSGTALLSAHTNDDQKWTKEARVIATVSPGSGYTVASPSLDFVTVKDDEPVPPNPEVTIRAATSQVPDGPAVTFTVTASPAPKADLPVSFSVAQAGTETKTETVTIPAGKDTVTETFTVDDLGIEPGMEMTCTLDEGAGYTIDPAESSVDLLVPDASGGTGTGPEVTITAATSQVTEGEMVAFTVTATPAPAASLTVNLRWTTIGGDMLPSGAGALPKTVTIPTTGSATLTADTENDSASEYRMKVAAALESGTGYRVGRPSSATVTVSDNDASRGELRLYGGSAFEGRLEVFIDGWGTVCNDEFDRNDHGANVACRQLGFSGGLWSSARRPGRLGPILLDDVRCQGTESRLLDCPHVVLPPESTECSHFEDVVVRCDTGEPLIPEVTIKSDRSSVTEGEEIAFTVTATPAPAASVTVNIRWGDRYERLAPSPPDTVTIPTSGSATLTASTEQDQTETTAGHVFAEVIEGPGYTIGSPHSAGVRVRDDDLPALVTIEPVASSVTEGEEVAFTVTATPPPPTSLTVGVEWSDPGNKLAASPPATVMIPTSGSATLTASTVDSAASKSDVTAKLNKVQDGGNYLVGIPGSATVTVKPLPPLPVVTIAPYITPVLDGTPVEFTLTATPPPAPSLTVNVVWSDPGNKLTASPPATVMIPTSGSATLTASTVDSAVSRSDVTATVRSGTGYRVSSNEGSASVTVDPNAGDLRLQDGATPTEGRLEVNLGGWGPICNDEFDRNANGAIVACRQLGLSGGVFLQTPIADRRRVGRTLPAFLLDDVQCAGTESRLLECPHNRKHNCTPIEYVSIRCEE